MSLPLFQQEESAAEQRERAEGEATLLSIEQRLLARDGPPRERPFWDPLKELIYVLLSARTRTDIALAVVAQLELHYGAARGDWTRLRDAPLPEVLSLVAPVTFSEKKAPVLQSALRRITRQNSGRLSLDFFEGQPVERIRRWLESFEGVGARGSAAVANHSSLRLRALAVDAHHHRIALRLGLAPKNAAAGEVEQRLLPWMPEERWPASRLTQLHDLLKFHGQVRCTAAEWQGNCPECPLLPLCPTGIRIAQYAPETTAQSSSAR